MVIYECQKCKKRFKQKCHYVNHTENKKYPCDDTPYNLINNNISNKKTNIASTGNKNDNKNDNNNDIDNDTSNNESNIKNDIINEIITHKNIINNEPNNKSTKVVAVENKNNITTNVPNEVFSSDKIIVNKNNTSNNYFNEYFDEDELIVSSKNLVNKKKGKNNIIILDDANDDTNNDTNNNININTDIDDNTNDKSINNEITKPKSNFVCMHCDKEYTRNDSLVRHINIYCKSKNKTDEFNKLKQKYEDLLFKYEEVLKAKGTINSNNSTNSNNTMNNSHNTNLTNTSNINIYQFGKEDYSKITNNDILKSIMSSTGAGIPVALIEKMHFNNEYPEFKNVCITDINRKHALLWNGKKWLRKKYEKIGAEMLDRCLCLISDRMDELEKLVTDKKTFGIKKKTIDRLEDINSDNEAEITGEDYAIVKARNEDRKNFRLFASDKIEESLYNNKDVIYQLTK